LDVAGTLPGSLALNQRAILPHFGEIIMMKLVFGTAFAGLLLAGPAYAADEMKCDEATMTKMQTDMDAMTDPAKKEMAMKSMEMAKTAMKDNKMDECMTQVKATMDAMKN
jgi:hypothetical protein